MKKWVFRVLYLCILLIVTWLCIETVVYGFSKMGRLQLADNRTIAFIADNTRKETGLENPAYIPHPYFGYIYPPNVRIEQFNYVSNIPVIMESNSDGFIDTEFPRERKEGVCTYGLFGGSAAMSWGVVGRQDRISYNLEKLLNAHLKDDVCREYRVLNLGVGSHILYQSTQIYLYYKKVLDGAIYFGGFNECAHGAMLTNNDPVEFPIMNLYASLTIPSMLVAEIIEKKKKLATKALFLQRHPYLVYSPSVRFIFGYKAKEIEKLRSKLQDAGHSTVLPSIKGKYKEELKKLFPAVTPMNLLQSYGYDNPDVPKVIEKIVPLVYTDPVLNGYAASRTNNTKFINIIQPMIFMLGRDLKYKESNFATYYFQATCINKLTEQAKRLETCGVKTYDLNRIDVTSYKREHFIDQVHLTKEGTRNVSRILFDLIRKEWHAGRSSNARQ